MYMYCCSPLQGLKHVFHEKCITHLPCIAADRRCDFAASGASFNVIAQSALYLLACRNHLGFAYADSIMTGTKAKTFSRL